VVALERPHGGFRLLAERARLSADRKEPGDAEAAL
jgi:hypothetical protein